MIIFAHAKNICYHRLLNIFGYYLEEIYGYVAVFVLDKQTHTLQSWKKGFVVSGGWEVLVKLVKEFVASVEAGKTYGCFNSPVM